MTVAPVSNTASINEGVYTVTITNSIGSVTSEPATFSIDANENQLGDSWETTYFGNLNQTPGGDFDGDDISNLDEFQNGTNPVVREIYYWLQRQPQHGLQLEPEPRAGRG